MGQRHQLFIKSKTNENQIENETHLSAFHHQWLYGGTLLSNIRNLVTFMKKADTNYKFSSKKSYLGFSDIDKIVENSFTFNPSKGYYYRGMINLNEEAKEDSKWNLPEYQDNNDGQTFIDYTRGVKPYIGITFPHNTTREPTMAVDTENEDEMTSIEIQEWKVMTIRDYVNLYYEVDLILENPKHDWFEFVSSINKDLKYLENNTKPMEQEDLYCLYPHLKTLFDPFKGKCLDVQKELKSAS